MTIEQIDLLILFFCLMQLVYFLGSLYLSSLIHKGVDSKESKLGFWFHCAKGYKKLPARFQEYDESVIIHSKRIRLLTILTIIVQMLIVLSVIEFGVIT